MRERKSLSPNSHTNKDVRRALVEILLLQAPGFELLVGGHWGMLRCAHGCCAIAVNGTPRNGGTHAKQLKRAARRCRAGERD